MNVKELYSWGVQVLDQAGIETPELDTRLLIENAFGWKSNTLQIHMKESAVSAEQRKRYEAAIDRRSSEEPIAYILESAFFCGKEYITRPGVLIPRPETEQLIEVTVNLCKSRGWEDAEIWDVGAGSGCIGIEIAHQLDRSEVVLWEKTSDAVSICTQNLNRFGLSNARLIHCDFFSDSAIRSRIFTDRPLIIVSNPPYIPIMDIAELPGTVRDFEPHTALNGGIDGLDFYRLLADPIMMEAIPNAVVLEVGINQAQEVAMLLAENGGVATEIFSDLQGIERVVTAVWNG